MGRYGIECSWAGAGLLAAGLAMGVVLVALLGVAALMFGITRGAK